MPLLTISYAFQLLDKTSLSYAAMLGIKTDLVHPTSIDPPPHPSNKTSI